MMIGKLYLKMLLAFVAVLIAADAVVVTFILSDELPPPLKRHVAEKVVMTGKLIKNELDGHPDFSPQRLDKFLGLLSSGFRWKIWVTDRYGQVWGQSFDGPVPEMGEHMASVDLEAPGGTGLYVVSEDSDKSLYATSAIKLRDGTPLEISMLSKKRRHKEEEWFLKGLLFLTGLGALFFIPVSRHITRPLHQLSEAADKLGQGDFSRRVKEKGNDEVAVLAKKFNRMADRLQKMIMSGKELTAHLSHELRSPLARMRISLQILMEGNAGTGGREAKMLARLADEIENMDKLIGHILDLSKLDMRESAPMSDRVDLRALVLAALEKVSPILEARNLALEKKLGSVSEYRCNNQDMIILLDNILSNAAKYAEPGGLVSVELEKSGRAVSLRVANTNPPLSEKDLRDMFVPFHRLNREKGTGTGLGLAVAQRIARIHGGEIRAHYRTGLVVMDIELPVAS